MHYHVLSGIHGCMPDNNESFTNKKDAKHYFADVIKRLKDEGYVVKGSVNSGYFEIHKGFQEELGRIDYVEISNCYELACEHAMENEM